MNKFLVLILIVVIVLFAMGKINIPELKAGSVFNSDSTTTESTTNNYYDSDVPTHEDSVDLCALFQPYIDAGATDVECQTNGGTWACNDNYVGCSDLPVPIIDCSGIVVRTAMTQCNSVGGNYICDTNNAYCYMEV